MDIVFASTNINYVLITEELLDDYLVMVNDIENVGRLIGRTKEVSREAESNWIKEKIEEKACIFSMIEKKTNEFIGNIELMDLDSDEAELGIAITKDKQELGYGTESINTILEYAFNKLKLKRVFLKAYPFNLRAIHVYKKCGFKETSRTYKDIYMEICR